MITRLPGPNNELCSLKLGVVLINLIKEKLKIHTEDEIIDLIDLSINKNWKNIIWSRIEGENQGMKAFYDSFAL